MGVPVQRCLLRTVVALVLAGPAAAQTPGQPNLVFTISGGLTTGSALWSLPRQVVQAPNGLHDTLEVGRVLRPGLTAVLNATYYKSANLGFTLEGGYFGVASEGRCAAVGGFRNDGENKNQQACTATQGAHYPTSVVGFQAGVTYRMRPTSRVSPFVRASAGIGAIGNSYIETSSAINAPTACSGQGASFCNWFLLKEPSHKAATWVVTMATGVSIGLGVGYQLRVEARDFIVSLPVAVQSAPPASGQFPSAVAGTRTRHVATLTAGLEVILERRHGRRY